MPLDLISLATSSTSADVHQSTPHVFCVHHVFHPISGVPISGPFYAPGATWDSTFGKVASAYEECRAECCGIYLCLERTVLTVAIGRQRHRSHCCGYAVATLSAVEERSGHGSGCKCELQGNPTRQHSY